MRQPTQLASGFAMHLVVAVVIVAFLGSARTPPAPIPRLDGLVWTARPGVDGGGRGGDGARASAASLRPVVPQPAQRFVLPRMPDILGALELPGQAILMAAGSEGIGTDALAGTGKGEGPEGPGSGVREGAGAGTGDGPFVDGTPGLTSPRVVLENKPAYTNEAMRARIQGAVLIEAVVREDGTVGGVKVVRSLDGAFGLDREAVKAVRAWRFQPGTYEGRPVPVRVLIELFFTLR